MLVEKMQPSGRVIDHQVFALQNRFTVSPIGRNSNESAPSYNFFVAVGQAACSRYTACEDISL
jgi:hypothetical protein